MEFIIYLFPILVILNIIYNITKYSGIEPYEKKHIEYYRDKNFTEYSPIIWGYILNKKFKKETVISTVLLYVKKGYITMTKMDSEYEFRIKEDLKEIDEIDLWAIGLFFINGTTIGKIQYLSNFNRYMWIKTKFGLVKDFKKETDTFIKEYLSMKKIINYIDKKRNINNIIFSCVITMITLIFSIMVSANIIAAISMSVFFIIGYSTLILVIEKSKLELLAHGTIFFGSYFCMGMFNKYSLLLIVTALLTFVLIYIDDKILRVEGKNGEVIEKALGLKRYITDFSNIDKYNLESISVWDEYYIYSIALGINKA